MSNRMKTGIFISIAVFLLGILLFQFAVPKGSFVQEEVTDEALTKELGEIATTALKDYFDIELDESRPWETMVVYNKPRDEEADIVPVYSVMQKDVTEDLPEGTITSYGVAMREDTKEVVSIIYTPVSNGEVKEMTDEEIGNKSISFLQDKNVSKKDETLKVVQIERDEKSGLARIMIEGQGMGYSIAYNLKTDSVNYFEKAEIIVPTE